MIQRKVLFYFLLFEFFAIVTISILQTIISQEYAFITIAYFSTVMALITIGLK